MYPLANPCTYQTRNFHQRELIHQNMPQQIPILHRQIIQLRQYKAIDEMLDMHFQETVDAIYQYLQALRKILPRNGMEYRSI